MQIRDSDEDQSVALYWDFENLHASLCEGVSDGSYGRQENRFKVQDPLVDVQAVVELAASFGPVAINRAYCNWQFFGRYRDALLQSAVELIQLFPPGGSAKNGADIKLCLDAMEDLGRFDHIGTVIIVGGDSDFMPVSQKIKASGRRLVGVATRKATNRHWAKSCHEFRYYESLVEVLADVAERTAGDERGPQSAEPGVSDHVVQTLSGEKVTRNTESQDRGGDLAGDILRRAIRLLADTQGDVWVKKGPVGPMIRRLDPTFDPKEHGHADFRSMIKAYGAMVEVREGDSDQFVRLR